MTPPAAPVHAPGTAPPADLLGLAERIGAYRWVEMQLFEILGGWARSTPEPAVAARFGTVCPAHAWHAEVWERRMPAVPGASLGELTRPGHPALVELVDALRTVESTVARLVGVWRVVVPALVATYSWHRRSVDELIDAPTARALDLVLADELSDWREGELLVQAALDRAPDGQDAAAAASEQHRLQSLLRRAGGIAGPR